jgi:hypothetical protein
LLLEAWCWWCCTLKSKGKLGGFIISLSKHRTHTHAREHKMVNGISVRTTKIGKKKLSLLISFKSNEPLAKKSFAWLA